MHFLPAFFRRKNLVFRLSSGFFGLNRVARLESGHRFIHPLPGVFLSFEVLHFLRFSMGAVLERDIFSQLELLVTNSLRSLMVVVTMATTAYFPSWIPI